MDTKNETPFFSVIVVCLNAGEKLHQTIESIREQTCTDYEIVVKDGFSKDGSVEQLEARNLERVYITREKDRSIYHAMNQAVAKAAGKYLYFLNCGDFFFDKEVLQKVKEQIETRKKAEPAIFYGNIYEVLTRQIVQSNPKINAFACYRNVPCHQACFYQRELLREHGFMTEYSVRADYEQFLWCYFVGHAQGVYMPLTIARYEGGGFSETPENIRRSKKEHREVTAKYMSDTQRLWYRFLLGITFAPLRTRIASNEKTAALYNQIKTKLYRRE